MASEFDVFIAHRRAEYVSEQALVSLFSEVAHAVITVLLIWGIFAHQNLLLWLGASISISLLAFCSRKKFVPGNEIYSIFRWRCATATMSFASGFIWGVVPVLFFDPGNIIYLVFITALYTGYVSGGQAVSFTYNLNFIIFSIGVTLPFAGRMFYQGGEPYSSIGALAIFYVGSLIYVSKNSSDLFLVSTKVQFANKQLAAELAKEKETVEQAVAAKDRFLASASHDLRQPLNAISLFADALRPLQTKASGHEIVDKIRQSLKGLNGMLHSLLDLSRLDANIIENQPEHISLHTLVKPLCDEYQEKAPHLAIHCEVERDQVVFIDPTILYRVVRNLIDNAVKYTPAGEVTLSSYRSDAAHTQLKIKDTGIGVAEDKLGTIFDEFEQLNNPERNREKGLGLGLAIVKRLCAIANINIEIQSVISLGTRVTLELINGAEDQNEAQTSQAHFDFSGMLVVVADDEEDILVGMQHLLSNWGCEVIAADSLQQALYKLSQQASVPDFIISDLRLQAGEQGDDFIEAIRDEYNKDLPAILVTGDTAPDRISLIKNSGLTVMYKPIEPMELKQELSQLFKAFVGE